MGLCRNQNTSKEAAVAATSAQLGKKGTHRPVPLPLRPRADTRDPLLSSQGGKKKMETTTDLVEENRKQEIIHRGLYTIYPFLFEAGWVGGLVGWLVWSCFGIRKTRSRGNQFFLAETKMEAKIGGAIL